MSRHRCTLADSVMAILVVTSNHHEYLLLWHGRCARAGSQQALTEIVESLQWYLQLFLEQSERTTRSEVGCEDGHWNCGESKNGYQIGRLNRRGTVGTQSIRHVVTINLLGNNEHVRKETCPQPSLESCPFEPW